MFTFFDHFRDGFGRRRHDRRAHAGRRRSFGAVQHVVQRQIKVVAVLHDGLHQLLVRDGFANNVSDLVHAGVQPNPIFVVQFRQLVALQKQEKKLLKSSGTCNI